MNPMELFDKVKELIEKKDFEQAKSFIAENKEELGEYFEQAKKLVEGSKGINDLAGKVKGLFGK